MTMLYHKLYKVGVIETITTIKWNWVGHLVRITEQQVDKVYIRVDTKTQSISKIEIVHQRDVLKIYNSDTKTGCEQRKTRKHDAGDNLNCCWWSNKFQRKKCIFLKVIFIPDVRMHLGHCNNRYRNNFTIIIQMKFDHVMWWAIEAKILN